MASWAAFAAEASDMAEQGRSLWAEHGLMYLATVRADGSPRVHPVVPVLARGRLFVAIPSWSPKWRDLDREPRCVLHSLPGERDDEFVLRCRARGADAYRPIVAAVARHVIHDDDHLYELDIEQADLGYWENLGRPDTYAVRHRWALGQLTQLKPA